MTVKIIIAEDEEHIGQMVSFKLERSGFNVIWKQDGASALEAVRTEIPDAVILDVMMPNMNGFEVLEAIKQDKDLKHIPVIMLTAQGQESDIVSGIDKGAADYLVKPFRPAELLARVKRLLADNE
jgi:two-component system, OmpR family, alkaline phosphatase synthesis response regulator PhoP